MSKRLQNNLEKQKKESIKKRTSWAVLSGYLVGGISALYAGNEYNKTFIDYKIPLIIAVIAGVFFCLLTNKYFKEYSGKKFRYYIHLFWSILTFGGFVTGLLFLINSLFGKEQPETLKKPILSVNNVPKRGNTYAEIDLGEYTKDIRFDIEEKSQVEAANYIVFTVQQGFFRYSIIKGFKLSKE